MTIKKIQLFLQNLIYAYINDVMTKSICTILINYNDGDKIENVLNDIVNLE